MKLTRGKISKLYNKKKQTLKKLKNRKTSYRRKTIVNKKRVNLARGTLKKINYKKTKSTTENEPKYEGFNSDISLVDKNICENLTTKNTNEIGDKPVVKEHVNEESVSKEEVIEEPVINEEVNEEPVNEEPVNEKPVIKEPVNEEPDFLDELISIDLNELIVENQDNEDSAKEIEKL